MEAGRPCPKCDRPPTPEGYDACLGLIPGATSACCGHGVHEPILMMETEMGNAGERSDQLTCVHVKPPVPSPMYRLTSTGGAVCRVCGHKIRKVCAVAYYAHGKSVKHRRALTRFEGGER